MGKKERKRKQNMKKKTTKKTVKYDNDHHLCHLDHNYDANNGFVYNHVNDDFYNDDTMMMLRMKMVNIIISL